jgi:SAM-dependent methyltransferase
VTTAPEGQRPVAEPAAVEWLTSHADWIASGVHALDVACGRGRHALWLARRGVQVRAVDRDASAVAALARTAAVEGLSITAVVEDLERPDVDLGRGEYDLIVVVHYLHRPLFHALIDALRPGGLLLYETFTRAQRRRGKPTNPDFLLEPGELVRLTGTLTLLDQREGEFGNRDVASVVCRRDADGRQAP